MKKSIAISVILLCLSIIANAEMIIVEAGTTGINSQWYHELGGIWDNSVSKSRALGTTPGIYSRFSDVTVSREAIAKFAPEFKEGGLMEVFVTWGGSANADHVKFTIYHRDGITDRYLRMDGWGKTGPSNKDSWTSLGQYYFNPGTGGAVEVIAKEITGVPDPINFARIYADTVKFVSVSSGTTIVTPPPAYTPVPIFTPYPTPAPTPIATIAKTPVYTTSATPTPAPVSTPISITTPVPVSTPTATLPSSASEIKWFSDYQTAKVSASKESKKLVLYFRTSKSKDSQKYEEQVFTTPEIIQLLSNMVCVKIDLLATQELAFEKDVYRAPTIILYNSSGEEIKRTSAFLDVNEFKSFLQGM